jgi:hypothetical protein
MTTIVVKPKETIRDVMIERYPDLRQRVKSSTAKPSYFLTTGAERG